MGEGDDMQQSTTGWNQTQATVLETKHALPGELPGHYSGQDLNSAFIINLDYSVAASMKSEIKKLSNVASVGREICCYYS